MSAAVRPGPGIDHFEGRVAVVTGGASGIGLAIARALAAGGATVVVADLDGVAAEAAAREVDGHAYVVDVSDADAVGAMASWVAQTFETMDILVNNAGVGPLDQFRSLGLADFRWVFEINFWGVVHGTAAFLPMLEANPRGSAIVNTASMAALLPSAGITAYGASKAAVLSLSDSLRAELEPAGDVAVMVLLPALVDTNILVNAARRPSHDDRSRDGSDFLPSGRTIDADHVGLLVVDGLRRGATHVFTHNETADGVAARCDELLSAYQKDTTP